ncbi:MAG: DUF4199 family protein [Bacteroidia bacterium]
MEVKVELKYGFWMAFAMFVWWVIEYQTGIQSNNLKYLSLSINISNFAVIIIGLFLALTAKKRTLKPSNINYSTLAISAGITLLASGILILALTSLFYHFVNTGWQEYATNLNIEQFANELEGEELTKKREMYMAMFAPGSMGMQNFARFIFYGFFLLFIESFVVLKLPVGQSN